MEEKNEETRKNVYIDILKQRIQQKTAQAASANLKTKQTSSTLQNTKKDDEKKKQNSVTEEVVSKTDADWKSTIKNENRSVKKVEEPKKKQASVLKILGIVCLCVVLSIGLIIGGYFVFLQITYSRLADMRIVQTENNVYARLNIGSEYSITTFNIGFGAYDQNFSFFMDEGELSNGTKTKGKYAKADSEESVINNTNEAINLLKLKANSDFYFFQEVDSDSTRSHYVNQVDMFKSSFTSYASSYSVNAHSKYLFYPLNDPIGRINSGILTLSKFNIDFSMRRSLAVDTGMLNKFFDLDRCFMVTKLPINGTNKNLVLINVHLSAYDEGNIRKEQIAMLYELMDYEYNTNGNYVVVGGDFNLCLAGDEGIFNYDMKTPNWCKPLPEGYQAQDFADIGYQINYDLSTTIGTCRDVSMKYSEGVNLEVIIDGFITSGNITVSEIETVDGKFKNSDHNPVKMSFKLS